MAGTAMMPRGAGACRADSGRSRRRARAAALRPIIRGLSLRARGRRAAAFRP